MRAEFYLNITEKLSKNQNLYRAVIGFNKAVTVLIYVFYPVFLGYLLITKNALLLKSILVPAISFLILSVVRYYINAPRPYEKIEGLKPLYNKKTLGKSFPSRHTFSGFIIGTVALFFNVYIGAVVLLLSGLLAICRVLCGVHFMRDVVCGALVGVVFGVVGMMLF